jgi:hypothetical protein
MTTIFSDSLTALIPMYYHFLDGYLNPDSGCSLETIKNLFKNNPELLGEKYDINLLSISSVKSYDDSLTNINNIYEFYNLKTYKTTKISDDRLEKDNFNYCIYQTGCDNHATSILFRINENKLYVDTFNSGLGIDLNGDPVEINNIDHYMPCKSFIFEGNLINIIISICNISIFYNYLKNIRHPNHISSKKVDDKMIYCVKHHFMKLLNKIKTFFKINNINNNEINFKLNGINILDITQTKVNMNIRDLNYTTHIERHNTLHYIHMLGEGTDYNIEDNISKYYNILITILDKLHKSNGNDECLIDDFKKFQEFPNIHINIKNKIILHHYNDKLYIIPQQNGSCSWFSIYWPIIYYNIYYNNYSDYCLIINNIYNNFIKELNNIFIEKNMNINTNLLTFMKIFFNKFYDIGLLKKKYIVLKDDYIYNSNISDLKESINPIEYYNQNILSRTVQIIISYLCL